MPEYQDDPLYRDLSEGFLTEGSNGGQAMIEIFGMVLWWTLVLITWPIRFVVRRIREI